MISREEHILACAAVWSAGHQHEGRLRGFMAGPVDGDRLIETAVREGLAGLLFRGLEQAGTLERLGSEEREPSFPVLLDRHGEFQRFGLSATVGNPDEMGRFLSGDREFSVVQVDVTKHLEISVEFAGDRFEQQAEWISIAIDRHRSTLIFVNTRVTAEALGHQLFSRGDVEVHHGSLSREVRIDAEERFKSGEIRCLICTSSMELGLDIGHIEHVIQFGSPREVSRLVPRIGRAGHSLYETSRGTILALGFDDLLESQVIARRAQSYQASVVMRADGLGRPVALSTQREFQGDWDRLAALLPHLDILFINSGEIAGLRGDELPMGMDSLRSGNPGLTCVVTCGKRGAFLLHEGRLYQVPAFPGNVVSTTGAGDAFNAAWLLYFARAGDPAYALKVSSAAASLALRGPAHTTLPRWDEVRGQIEAHARYLTVESWPFESDAAQSALAAEDAHCHRALERRVVRY